MAAHAVRSKGEEEFFTFKFMAPEMHCDLCKYGCSVKV